MSLETHRSQEFLGGIVYLLTIDMSGVTGDPTHIRRFVNNYGENGQGVSYQGNKYQPHPYELEKVQRSIKGNKSTTTVKIGDGDNFTFSRFVDLVGGSLQGARITELKVFGRFLDDGEEPNSLAYAKRLDHVVNYVEDSDTLNEVLIHTMDPLSVELKVPTLSFTTGLPNGTESAINIFPAVDRNISRERG